MSDTHKKSSKQGINKGHTPIHRKHYKSDHITPSYDHKWLVFNYVSCYDPKDYIFQEFGKLVVNNLTNNKNCIFLILIDIGEKGLYYIDIQNTVKIDYISRMKNELSDIRNFISNGLAKYNATNYSFIYSGHADCFYIKPKDGKEIHISVLNKTLHKMIKPYKTKWDIIILDTCLMSSVECVGELRNTCSYILTCENYASDNNGFCNNSTIDSFNISNDPIYIANEIMKESLLENTEPGIWNASLIDTEKMKNVFYKLNKMDIPNLPKTLRGFHKIKIQPKNTYFPYYDFYELIKRIYGDDNTLLTDIKSSIKIYVQNKSKHRKLHGIFICPSVKYYDYPVDYKLCWAYNNIKLLKLMHKKY